MAGVAPILSWHCLCHGGGPYGSVCAGAVNRAVQNLVRMGNFWGDWKEHEKRGVDQNERTQLYVLVDHCEAGRDCEVLLSNKIKLELTKEKEVKTTETRVSTRRRGEREKQKEC